MFHLLTCVLQHSFRFLQRQTDRQRAACLVMLGHFENLAVWCGGGTVPWLTGSLRGRAKDELWLRDVGISMCFESSTDIEAVMHTF